jgi:plasmid stabilization system protein ParE
MEKAERIQVIWSAHSKISLQSVFEYIALGSEFHANRVINEIQDMNPYKFQECPELPTKNHIYRKATYAGMYKIIYKILKQQIWILDVFHGKRSPAQLKKLKRIKA